MLRHYLVLAVKVLLRRKFFTFISLFGISFTLLVLMVATAFIDHMLAPMAPETRQHRMLGVNRAVMFGENSRWSGDAGFLLFDRYARDLPGVERLSIYSSAAEVTSYVDGRKISSTLKRTDAEFFQILEFTFLEGRPYSADEVAQAAFVAVISERTRERFFAGAPGVGRMIEADGQRFRVIGVVRNVPPLRFVPVADLWVPYTTAKTDAYRTQIMEGFRAIALARDEHSMRTLRDEFNARLARAELPDPRVWKSIVAPFETKLAFLARESPFADPRSVEDQSWKIVAFASGLALLFILLPTVNLVNINISRIMERSSEIGVRKAFGAPSRTLVAQFIVENVMLTLVGAAIGLALSALVLRALNESGIAGGLELSLNVRIFGWGLLFALLFGVLSGVYPAWRMSRLHPVTALKGTAR